MVTDFIGETKRESSRSVYTCIGTVFTASGTVISNGEAVHSGHDIIASRNSKITWRSSQRESKAEQQKISRNEAAVYEQRNIRMIQYRAYIRASYVDVYIVIQSDSKS